MVLFFVLVGSIFPKNKKRVIQNFEYSLLNQHGQIKVIICKFVTHNNITIFKFKISVFRQKSIFNRFLLFFYQIIFLIFEFIDFASISQRLYCSC